MMRRQTFPRAAFAALALLMATPSFAQVQYSYDSAGRLIRAIYGNGVTIQYRYDAAGNRTQIVTSNTPNTSPVAVNDSATVAASGVVDVYVRSNDSDANGDTLTVTSVGTPSGGGSAVIQGGGTHVRYTAPSTAGTKTFSYTVSDGKGGVASATVTVTVTSSNQAPVARDDATGPVYSGEAVYIDVLANDTDADGDPLTITGIQNSTNGSADIQDGYIVYSSNVQGTMYFDYTISDGRGGTSTATVLVDVHDCC